MRLKRLISVVDSHTAGEPTRVVLGGLPTLAGVTLRDKNDVLLERIEEYVGILTGEPRGHPPMHAVLPLPACDARADISFLILSALGSLTMCGHALIGAVTTLLEIGTLPRHEPTTKLVVETLAGLIHVEARVEGDRVIDVTFDNAPSWVLARDVELLVPGIGVLRLDLVYGGLWYAIAEAAQVGLLIEPGNAGRLVSMSHEIRRILNMRLPDLVSSPQAPAKIPQVLWVGPPATPDGNGRNMATSTELGFDRSPCGTGSSARMALLHARGQLPLRQPFVHESLLGTRFKGQLLAETTVAAGAAVCPSITGSAFITAFSQLAVDADDPLGWGFFISPGGS